jgi:gliding motility associated protien GldN
MILACAGMFCQNMSAQERRRTRTNPKDTQTTGLPEPTVRALSKNEDRKQNTENAPWIREIYRQINLKEAANAPLYYPVEPVGDRINLFTLIFKLLSENKITVYEYLDGKEIFTDRYKVNFKDFLDRFRVLYMEKIVGTDTIYVVDESDIPNSEVLSYLVKEAWYFKASNSTVDIKLLAICPLLIREGDFGEVISMPIFWIPYENIQPHISRTPIMTSDLNNAMTYTLDDYFRKRMFEGEIIKTTNLLNYTLAQQFSTPEAMKIAQDSIENHLKHFENQLWVQPDTTAVADSKRKKKSAKAEKPKTAKTQSTAPARSVKRTQ